MPRQHLPFDNGRRRLSQLCAKASVQGPHLKGGFLRHRYEIWRIRHDEPNFSPNSRAQSKADVVFCATIAAYHVGDPPDDRTMATLEDHGITDYYHAGRKVRWCSLSLGAPGRIRRENRLADRHASTMCRCRPQTSTSSTTSSPWTDPTYETSKTYNNEAIPIQRPR